MFRELCSFDVKWKVKLMYFHLIIKNKQQFVLGLAASSKIHVHTLSPYVRKAIYVQWWALPRTTSPKRLWEPLWFLASHQHSHQGFSTAEGHCHAVPIHAHRHPKALLTWRFAHKRERIRCITCNSYEALGLYNIQD